jgi:hypothetical protein
MHYWLNLTNKYQCKIGKTITRNHYYSAIQQKYALARCYAVLLFNYMQLVNRFNLMATLSKN